MLNKNTQTVLKSLLSINNSFVISYPKMTIVDEYKTMMGMIDMEKLGDSFEEFGIYDAGKFLSALDLMDEANFELKNNLLVATDSTSSMDFLTSMPSSLPDAVAKESVITTTAAIDSVMEYGIDIDTLTKLKKAAGIFKTMDALFLKKESDEVTMKMGSKDAFNASNNSYNIKIAPDMDTANDFELPIPLENILKLPLVDYTVKIKHNAERDMYRVLFTNEIYTFVFTLMK